MGHYLTSYMNGLLAVAAHVPDLRGDMAANMPEVNHADRVRSLRGGAGGANRHSRDNLMALDPLDGDFKSMA